MRLKAGASSANIANLFQISVGLAGVAQFQVAAQEEANVVVQTLTIDRGQRWPLAACLGVPQQSFAPVPPYRTDDPEPTELGHYEFYVLSSGLVSRTVKSGYLPGIELDYGLIPNGQ